MDTLNLSNTSLESRNPHRFLWGFDKKGEHKKRFTCQGNSLKELIYLLIAASIIVCGLIAYMLFNNKNMKIYNHYMKRKKMLEESICFFTSTQTYGNQNMIIAINEKEKELCVSTMKSGTPVPLVYKFDEIMSCEINEYAVTETAALKNNQVKGQKVANVLADSVGKVAGSRSGKAVEDRINRIDLKISFNDSHNPFVLANFLFWEVSKDSEEYQTASKDVSHWYNIIDTIVKGERTERTLAFSNSI